MSSNKTNAMLKSIINDFNYVTAMNFKLGQERDQLKLKVRTLETLLQEANNKLKIIKETMGIIEKEEPK
jgi:hypothetical protein